MLNLVKDFCVLMMLTNVGGIQAAIESSIRSPLSIYITLSLFNNSLNIYRRVPTCNTYLLYSYVDIAGRRHMAKVHNGSAFILMEVGPPIFIAQR